MSSWTKQDALGNFKFFSRSSHLEGVNLQLPKLRLASIVLNHKRVSCNNNGAWDYLWTIPTVLNFSPVHRSCAVGQGYCGTVLSKFTEPLYEIYLPCRCLQWVSFVGYFGCPVFV